MSDVETMDQSANGAMSFDLGDTTCESIGVPEETYEESIARRYSKLGTQIANLSAERDALKEQEILPAMADGIVFGYGDKALVWEFSNRVDFDYQRARSDGAITDEMWKQYANTTVQRKLIARKRDDEGRQALSQQLQVMKSAPKLLKALQMVAELDNPAHEIGEVDVLMDTIHAAIKDATE